MGSLQPRQHILLKTAYKLNQLIRIAFSTSSALVLCDLSQPLFCHCCKDIFIPHDKQLGCRHDTGNQVFLLLQPAGELLCREHMRIDFPSQLVRNAGEQPGYLPQPDFAYDHEVNVALSRLPSIGKRAENKSAFDFVLFQGFAQDIGQPRGFEDNAADIFINRVSGVGLEADSIAVSPGNYQSKLLELDGFLPY
jgi:hypothetical protein